MFATTTTTTLGAGDLLATPSINNFCMIYDSGASEYPWDLKKAEMTVAPSAFSAYPGKLAHRSNQASKFGKSPSDPNAFFA